MTDRPGWPGLDPEVDRAAAGLKAGLDPLVAATRLRRELGDPERARAAAQLARLRERATGKLAHARRLWLTRRSLEQASDRRVAAHRARRVARWIRDDAPDAWVHDATAGIGSDSMALLKAGLRRIVSADADPSVACMLAWNLTMVGRELGTDVPARVLHQRAEASAVRAQVLLLDPDRRSDGHRIGDPARWSPSFDACMTLARAHRAACIKLAPATEVERLELPDGLPCSFAWVSLRGELKEVTLWTGELALPAAERGAAREAVALDADGESVALVGSVGRAPVHGKDVHADAREVAFLADPDPALLRSGLLGAVARLEGMAQLAADIPYLGGARPPASRLLRAFEVLGAVPLDRKRIRSLLEAHDVGPLTVKKRGHADDADELARRFRGRGANHGTLVVTRLATGHHAYLVRPVGPAQESETE